MQSFKPKKFWSFIQIRAYLSEKTIRRTELLEKDDEKPSKPTSVD